MKTDHIPDNWTIDKTDDGLFITDEHNIPRCGGKRTNGLPCRKHPLNNGNGRCKIHNGHAPRGTMNPNYKHGRYSQYAPPSLRERMERVTKGELTDLDENMALIDARLSMMVERVQDGDFGASATEALAIWNQGSTKLRNRQIEAFIQDYNELGRLLQSARDEQAVWQNIMTLNRERRDMAKTVHQMIVQKEGMMQATEVMQLILKLAELFMSVNQIDERKERELQFKQGADRIIRLQGTG